MSSQEQTLLLTLPELAAALEVDATFVDDLLQAGLPRREDGRFNWHVVAAWIQEQGLGEPVHDGTPSETAPAGPTGIVKTIGEVARAFGVTLDTVKKGWRPSGMPGKRGRWDLAEIARWKRLRNRDPGEPASASDIETLSRRRAAEARIKEAEADRRERENRVKAGDLLQRSEVERWATTVLVETREQVMQLPDRLANLAPPEIRNQLREEADRHCRELLMVLRRRLEKTQ